MEHDQADQQQLLHQQQQHDQQLLHQQQQQHDQHLHQHQQQQQQQQPQQQQQQQPQQQQEPNLEVAVSTLFPAFDNYVKKQTELNEAQIQQIERNKETNENKQLRSSQEKIRIWSNEEAQHILCCDGGSLKSVREWIRSIKCAYHRAPELDRDYYVKKLISKTSRGDLFEEIELFLNSTDRELATAADIVAHVLNSFLGPDEQDALRDEVKAIKQGQNEEIPAFNRRYLKAVGVAYPRPTTEEEKMLTTMYLVALKKGRIQDRLFDRDQRLTTLKCATEIAYNEWARARFRHRALQDARQPRHEPMEVDAISTREAVAEKDQEIKKLRQQLEAARKQSPPQRNTTTTAPRSSDRNNDECRFCHQKGHWVRDCPKNKDYWAKKGGERRPLPKGERELN